MTITLTGDPRTKKNSPRIIRIGRGSRILPSLTSTSESPPYQQDSTAYSVRNRSKQKSIQNRPKSIHNKPKSIQKGYQV